MPVTDPFPLNITPKVNSPALLAWIQQFGHESFADADDLNKIITALEFLKEGIDISSTPSFQEVTDVNEKTNKTIGVGGLNIADKVNLLPHSGTVKRDVSFPDKVGTIAFIDDLAALQEGLSWKQPAELLLQNADVVQSGSSSPKISSLVKQGHTLGVGSRVIITEYNTPSLNGIYRVSIGPDVNTGHYLLSRVSDANTSAELNNAVIGVTNGTYAGKTFRQSTINPVLGTSNIVFVDFGSAVAAATNALAGISKLYNALGSEIDGGITPKAVNDSLALKANISDVLTAKNNIGIISTFNGASVSLVGGSATVTYQQLNIGVVATTNNFTMNPRTTMVSNTGSGGLSFISVNTTNSFSASIGFSFKYDFLVGIEFYRVNAEHFFGYINSAVNPTNVSPTTFINCFGLARIKTSNNFHIIHNDGSAPPTLIDLGVNFPSNTSATDLYNVVFNNIIGVGLQYTVNRINSVGVISNTITGIITTDLPATNLLLCQKYINSDSASINPGSSIVFCKSQINLN
jgi:hypothetical protein